MRPGVTLRYKRRNMDRKGKRPLDPFDDPAWPSGDIMGPDISVGDLAQRALGDAFDQLVRVGSSGSARCHRYSQIPYTEAERLSAATARALLASAHNALRYAEQQLQYLDMRPDARSSAAGGDDSDADDALEAERLSSWTQGGRALAAPDSGP